MQLIFDNLTAVIVSAILLGTVLTVNLRGQESAVEATQFHAAKQQQAALINMVEYDFEDLGSGVPTGEQMIVAYDVDVFGVKEFEFRREFVDNSGEATLASVRYSRVLDGTYETADGATLPRFRILRYVEAEDGSMARSTGDGFPVISFDIELVDDSGEAVATNLNDASSINVSLRTSLPFQAGEQIQYMSWDGAFRPSNLARRGGAAGGVGVGT